MIGNKSRVTHGHCPKIEPSRTYRSWNAMLNRVRLDRPGYEHVTVCNRWLKFENFLADMGERPEGMTLDRKDNDRGYCKSNCRWATQQEQARNRRTTKLTEYAVSVIKWLLCNGYGQRRISRAYGVSQPLIHSIAHGRLWPEVEPCQ